MKNLKFIITTVSVILYATVMNAKADINDGFSTQNVITIKNTVKSTDGLYNYKSFEIDVTEMGTYFTEFWLLPAKHTTGDFTRFKIYLNDEYVGEINPTEGNWQSAKIENAKSLFLKKGLNVISVGTESPEFPNVESLKLSVSEEEATFNSDNFDVFLKDATENMFSSEINIDGVEGSMVNNYGYQVFDNIKLKYSFISIYSFTEGQDIFITSSSYDEHCIDMVFFGAEGNHPFQINQKGTNTYVPATPEEMQGLNWLGISQKTLNSTAQVARIHMTIPKTGLYLVKLRHKDNNKITTADLNVNGLFYYENVPVSFSSVECNLSAKNIYTIMTMSNNQAMDDPMLFIHGSAGKRIVGFNDDAPYNKVKLYGISVKDAFIEQSFSYPVSSLSVCNLSSLNPLAECKIYVAESSGDLPVIPTKMPSADNFERSKILNDMQPSIEFNSFNNSLKVVTAHMLKNIYISDILGNVIATFKYDGQSAKIPLQTFNFSTSGFYLIIVETNVGITSKKMYLK